MSESTNLVDQELIDAIVAQVVETVTEESRTRQMGEEYKIAHTARLAIDGYRKAIDAAPSTSPTSTVAPLLGFGIGWVHKRHAHRDLSNLNK